MKDFREFKTNVINKLSSKVSQKLDEKKQEMAKELFNEAKKPVTKEGIDEVLTKSTPIEDWIKDFIDSDAPQFKGKTKKERIEMAKGAYYAKQRGE